MMAGEKNVSEKKRNHGSPTHGIFSKKRGEKGHTQASFSVFTHFLYAIVFFFLFGEVTYLLWFVISTYRRQAELLAHSF